MAGTIEIVVIGGGYSGAMAANRLTQRDDVTVTLINSRASFVERIRLHQLVGGNHDAVVDYREILAERVRLAVDTVTRIDAAERSVTLASGDRLGYDYLIYAVGSRSVDPSVPGAAEYAHPTGSLEQARRLLTDETLTSVDDDRILATGDAAAPSDLPLWMSCQAALPLGAHAADTVLSRIGGEQPADFTKGIAAICVSLGRRAGVFQFAHRNDTAVGLHLGGRLGAQLKESACRSPIKQLADEARKPGSHAWPVKDAKRRQVVRDRRGEALTTG